MLDTQLLEDEILKSGYRKDYICETLGLSSQAFWKKRKGLVPFKDKEIKKLIDLFGWTAEKVMRIFFAKGVEK